MRHWTLLLLAVFFAITALQGCHKKSENTGGKPLDYAYGSEPDWNNPQQLISLNYQQTQGQRIFYNDCVWCHANTTPAGPSNISNLNPPPALANDGATLNGLTNDYLQNVISLGGSAMSKSGMMPAWDKTLRQDEVQAVIAFMRQIAQPPYQGSSRTGPKYSAR